MASPTRSSEPAGTPRGADVIFVDAPGDERDLVRIAEAGIGVPLMVNVSEHGKTPDLGAAAFEELGYSLVIYPTSTLFAAAQSTRDLAERADGDGLDAGRGATDDAV